MKDKTKYAIIDNDKNIIAKYQFEKDRDLMFALLDKEEYGRCIIE